MLNYKSNLADRTTLYLSLVSFFSKSKLSSSKYICVDYVPISTFCGPLCYCVMEYEKESFKVHFKPTFSSSTKSDKVLRGFNIGAYSLLSDLNKVLHQLESTDYTDEWYKAVWEPLDVRKFEFVRDYFKDVEQESYASAMEPQIASLSQTLTHMSTDATRAAAVPSLKAFCNSMIKIITEYISCPDTWDDVFGYAALSTGNLEGEYKLMYIPEISAINIVTPHLTKLQDNPTEYDKYMFMANYEMLRLFTNKARPGIYKYPPQNTVASLSEFVPVAMKFKHIYNPLFDTKGNIWETLCKNYRWLQTSEVCDNKCSAAGFRIDQSSEVYVPSDPDTYHLGRIYYGLCCNIDQAFNREQTPIVPYQDHSNGIQYCTDLAAAIVFRMLVNEGFLKSTDLEGRIAWFDDSVDDKSYISACTVQPRPLLGTIPNHISKSDFVYTMIYRTLLANDSRSYDPVNIARDAGLMQQQFSSITLNTFGGF